MNEVNRLARTPEATLVDSDSNSSGNEDPHSDNSDQETDLETKQDKDKFALQIEDDKPHKRHWGKNFVCCFRNGEPLLTLGPDWPFYLCTLSLMMGVGGLIIWLAFQKKDAVWFKYLTVGVVFWQGFIYSLTACLNPGLLTHPAPTIGTDILYKGEKKYCKHCKIIKKKATYHCEDCDICTEEYDHHCPWTGKCIGKRNLIPFYLFLVSTVGYIMYCMFACIHAIVPTPN